MYNYQTKGTNKKIENKSKGNFLKNVLNEQCKKKKSIFASVSITIPSFFYFLQTIKMNFFFVKFEHQ
jgi:hypothetical protein